MSHESCQELASVDVESQSSILFRGFRGAATALLLTMGLLLGTAACGNNAQTLQPYTPAEGINLDVGNPADQSPWSTYATC